MAQQAEVVSMDPALGYYVLSVVPLFILGMLSWHTIARANYHRFWNIPPVPCWWCRA